VPDNDNKNKYNINRCMLREISQYNINRFMLREISQRLVGRPTEKQK
jgi:hypothetical protein